MLFLSFGAMIGWGWVVLSGNWVHTAGSVGATIAFIVGGILVSFVGLAYAELSSAMPTNGGTMIFAERGIGRKSAFIAAWG